MKSKKTTKVISYLLTIAMLAGGLTLSPPKPAEANTDNMANTEFAIVNHVENSEAEKEQKTEGESGTEAPKPEELGIEEPEIEEPGTEKPETEEPEIEDPETEEPEIEEPEAEAPEAEVPETEEPGTEEPETDDSETEEANAEEVTETEEPEADENAVMAEEVAPLQATANTAKTRNINLNTTNTNLNTTNTIAGIVKGKDENGSKVYFGSVSAPILWRTISSVSGPEIVSGNEIVTLLSDTSVGKRRYDESQHHKWGGSKADHSDASELCRWLNGYDSYANPDTNSSFLPSRFTILEKEAMQEQYSIVQETGHEGKNKFIPNQTIVVPSVAEANSWFSNDAKRKLPSPSDSDYCWLRSPGRSDSLAADVHLNGYVYSDGSNVSINYGVRPAFKLNLSSVLFTSASGASKSSSFAIPGDALFNRNTWNLTLKDGNTGFKAVRTSTGGLSGSVTVKVVDIGEPGEDTVYTQISAMLTDKDGTVLAYGKISGNEGAVKGDYTFTIPYGITGASKLYVFAEDVNSSATSNDTSNDTSNATDYASNMVDVTTVPQPTVTSVTVTPKTVSVNKGCTQAFSVTVNGSNSPAQTVTWSVKNTVSNGTISQKTTISENGVLTIGSDETATSLTVTATSTEDTSKSGTATVTVTTTTSTTPTVKSVTISPPTATVQKGGNTTFGATVSGNNNPAQTVTWSVKNAIDNGTISQQTTISANGVLTVGSDETATSLTVTATSTEDTSKSGTATVTVTTTPSTTPTVKSVTISPPTASVQKGGSTTFGATVSGNNNPAQTVTWSVKNTVSNGTISQQTTISANGVLTVGVDETATTLEVKATSTVDTTKSGTAVVTVTTAPTSEKNFWVEPIADCPYTGKAIKPIITAYDNTTKLTLNKDYKVTYKNNKNVYSGNDTKKKPQVIVTGIGNYKGTKIIPFTITPKNLSDQDVDITENIYKAASKKPQKPQKPLPTIRWGTKKLIYNKKESKSDYTLTYSAGDYKTAGTYTVTAKGIRNYCGTKTYQIILTNQKLISKASVSITPSMPYTGSKVVPTKLKVKMGSKTLIENTDYKVAYQNNTEIGKAYAIITGIGEYAGAKKVTYKITGRKLSSAKITGIENKEYTGKPIEQTYQVTYGKAEETLKEGTDYTVIYPSDEKRTNAGTVTMIFKGKGAYTGTLKKSFQIQKYSLKTNKQGYFANDNTNISVQYEKGGVKPDVTISFNGTRMQKGKDYSLTYQNHSSVNDGTDPKKVPTIIIAGKGNFKDTATKTFAITPGDLQADGVHITAKDIVYTNKRNKYRSTPILTDKNKKKLTAGKDYSKTYEYRHNDANGAIIKDDEIPPAGSTIHVSANGIKNYEGSSIGTTYRIVRKSISKAEVKVKPQTYTIGRVTITKADIESIKIGNTKLSPEDYEILQDTYTNNNRKGTAKVTIKGLGNYGQQKVITFKINAKPIER